MADDGLAGRRVLVTGSGAGIGAVTAREIVARGGKVAIFDMDGARAVDTAQVLGAESALSFEGDVRDPDAVEGVLDAMADAWGGIDDLVNNAGISDHGPLLELSMDQWRRVFDVNLMAPIAVSNAAVRRMGLGDGAGSGDGGGDAGGSVVNVTSVLGQVAAPGRGPYCVSKAALISLTKMQAVEWAERAIRVNAIAPGYIMTETTRAMAESGGFEAGDIRRRTPLGRLGTEEEVAEGICFLLDPRRAAYVTGHVLEVNGGWTAYGFV